MTERVALTAARAVAQIMGGTLEPGADGECWRAWVNLPDGLRLVFAKPYGSKGEVLAYLPRPGYPGDSAACGKIGADLTRDPDKLEKDIERRLLPDARIKADAARAEWAAQESARADLESAAAEFSAIPGVRVTVEKVGTRDQRLNIRYHQEGKGGLSAELYGTGNLYVTHVNAWGDDRKAQVRALISALSA